MLQWTSALTKLSKLTKRKRVVQGSTWAAKTYGIVALEIDYAVKHPKTKTTFCAETFPAVRDGVLSVFKEIMQDTHRWSDSHWNGGVSEYTFSNGSKIQFKAFDTVGKAKAAGKRDRLFINEANHMTWEITHALIVRTDGVIWMDFNADSRFWAHEEIMDESDADFLKLTYLDNECVSQSILDDIASARRKAAGGSKYWQNWVRVMADGEIGHLVGAVFEDWEICDKIPEGAELLGYGLDFGWEVPAAVVAVWKFEGKFYLDQIIYETKLSNQDLADMLLDYGIEDEVIYADNAEPKSIEEISRCGLNIHPCESKQDIRPFAIRELNNDTFYITKESEGIIQEFRKAVWGRDSKGQPTGKIKKGNDHGMDGTFYFIGSEGKYDGTY